MQEGDAGAHYQFSTGKVMREVAEVFYTEGGGEFGVVEGKANFFPCFAPGYLVWFFFYGVCLSTWECGMAAEASKGSSAHGDNNAQVTPFVRIEKD